MSYKEKRGFKWLVTSILILLFLYLLRLNHQWLLPLWKALNAVFVPLAITAVFYYLLRPFVDGLERRKAPRGIAVLIVFVLVGLLLAGIILTAGPFIRDQFAEFAAQVPVMIDFAAETIESLRDGHETLSPPIQEAIPNVGSELASEWNRYAGSIANSLLRVVEWISNALLILSLVPFILYYALKDSDKLTPKLARLAPERYRDRMPALLDELDDTLASYIRGKLIVSLLVGVMLLVCYLAIGLDYALVLACIGMFANIIPFFGPVIGAVPAMLAALFQDPVKSLYVLALTVIVQQIEGNFISPQVMGRTLDIHPVTVIVLILAAGSVGGLLGILLVVPAYAAAKVVLKHATAMRQQSETAHDRGLEE
ncbi:AI-2E family transporter [Paenibacillus soyae]|uniref:AI-2E family transporter n=1 Tax=Paenibacillus soyae TaxID=2969249 RepID=A0A9X2MPK5_9BACL|nr:AI-2E family transporter [Paenibacillus soyae]MCR2803508.1 AI-2E family transporter [Paenibacillus soyae]